MQFWVKKHLIFNGFYIVGFEAKRKQKMPKCVKLDALQNGYLKFSFFLLPKVKILIFHTQIATKSKFRYQNFKID